MRDARKDEGSEAAHLAALDPGLRPPALPKAAPCQALYGALGTLGRLRSDAGHKDSNPREGAVGASPRPPPLGWGSTSPQLSVLANTPCTLVPSQTWANDWCVEYKRPHPCLRVEPTLGCRAMKADSSGDLTFACPRFCLPPSPPENCTLSPSWALLLGNPT